MQIFLIKKNFLISHFHYAYEFFTQILAYMLDLARYRN